MTTPPTNPPEGMPELPRPVAYAIYQIAGNLRSIVPHGVELHPGNDNDCNDGGLGDYWAGNQNLYTRDQLLTYGRQCAAPKAPPMPEPNELHVAIRALGYTTHGQTAEIVDLVLALFRAQGITAKE